MAASWLAAGPGGNQHRCEHSCGETTKRSPPYAVPPPLHRAIVPGVGTDAPVGLVTRCAAQMSNAHQWTPVELIAGRHPGTAVDYYDAKAPIVRDYCAELCPPELVDDALLGAFIDLRARAAAAPRDADLDDLLRKAARAAAAARIQPNEGFNAPCRVVPDLLGAAMSDELADDRALNRHLGVCERCGAVAERFRRAEQAINETRHHRASDGLARAARPPSPGPAAREPSTQATAAWLPPALKGPHGAPRAGAVGPTAVAHSQLSKQRRRNQPSDPPHTNRSGKPGGRRGGLVGAARRWAPGRASPEFA